MKKIIIVLLAVFFIGITNVNAQDEVKPTQENTEVKEASTSTETTKKTNCPYTINAEGEKICTKTGTQKCSSKATKSSCSKTSKGEFNYGKKNNYSGKKSSCSSKKTKKQCCSKTASNKKCCSKTASNKKCCSKKNKTTE
ncbi:MAG: hypothetical protein CMD16_00185 [Flavobacteriales bacterium]|nr:hypothetical protein [Flavobacteriales bacterium]|tara:strand:+ start:9349 stop:9768 length:420 start_codon:yes stop_codon:yes gene_type:complete